MVTAKIRSVRYFCKIYSIPIQSFLRETGFSSENIIVPLKTIILFKRKVDANIRIFANI